MGSLCVSSSRQAKDPEGSPNSPYGRLPQEPDPELAAAYTCDILSTTQGLLKGVWGQFKASAFFRPIPGDAVRTVRHILIHSLEIVKYAEREGESIEVEFLGEGSYAKVYGLGCVAAKIISDRELPWVHKAAVENSIIADRETVGPCCFGYGTVAQSLGGNFKGTVLFMERLDSRGEVWSDEDTKIFLGEAQKVAAVGFHNDLKLDNILRRGERPVIIDYDLWTRWNIKVAVTTGCIEHSFQSLLAPLGESMARFFREYYDLFAFSLTVEDGPLYRAVLARLLALWSALASKVLRPLLDVTEQQKLLEVPFEVVVRVPLQGITVNLLDLRGNLFAHLPEGSATNGVLPESCRHLPQLLRSNGVYWPQQS